MRDKDGRVFYPHTLWEDHKAGLYNVGTHNEEKILRCVNLLSDQNLFWDVMCQMKTD